MSRFRVSFSSLAVLTAVLVASTTLDRPARAGGTIRGTVSFKGTPPAKSPVDRSTDPFCARTKSSEPDVAVKGGKLRDVHVGIKAGKAGKHTAPAAPVVIDQTGCAYHPRVVGIMAGQPLSIRNGDKTMHNVHVYVGRQDWLNRGQPAGSKPIRSDAAEPGDVMIFKCDVHPWMRAYAVVTDHPYFDVTGDDGSFTLKNVPPGRYTLEAFHPTLGVKHERVTVTDGKTTTVEFEYEPGDAAHAAH